MSGQGSHLPVRAGNSLGHQEMSDSSISRGRTIVTEQHGTYEAAESDGGIVHIRDVLQRLIDHHGWPPLVNIPRPNGNRPDTVDAPHRTDG